MMATLSIMPFGSAFPFPTMASIACGNWEIWLEWFRATILDLLWHYFQLWQKDSRNILKATALLCRGSFAA